MSLSLLPLLFFFSKLWSTLLPICKHTDYYSSKIIKVVENASHYLLRFRCRTSQTIVKVKDSWRWVKMLSKYLLFIITVNSWSLYKGHAAVTGNSLSVQNHLTRELLHWSAPSHHETSQHRHDTHLPNTVGIMWNE